MRELQGTTLHAATEYVPHSLAWHLVQHFSAWFWHELARRSAAAVSVTILRSRKYDHTFRATKVQQLICTSFRRRTAQLQLEWAHLQPHVHDLMQLVVELTNHLHRRKLVQLQKEWARLQPHVHDLMRKAGEVADSSFRDFLWAYSVFWCAPRFC